MKDIALHMRIDADSKDIEEARMVVVKRVDKFCFFVIFVGISVKIAFWHQLSVI